MVPAFLTAACPALRTLRLTDCYLRAPEDMKNVEQQQGEVAFPSQLQSLYLWYGTIMQRQQLLVSALAALPSLTSLDVKLLCHCTDSRVDMSTVLPALAGQLTQLAWSCEWHEQPRLPSWLASPAVLGKLSKLKELHTFGTTLDDAGFLFLLLNLPLLTHIGVRKVVLQHSHADAGCSWEELRMCTVTVTSLADLPLRGIKRVCVDELVSAAAAVAGDDGVEAAASHTAAARLTAALAAAPDCTLGVSNGLSLACRVAEMPLLLPLLVRWEGVERLELSSPTSECLTPAAVGALGALLERMPLCTHLIIAGLIPHPSALLLPALANTGVSCVALLHGRMIESHLMLWCAGGQASRPITVELFDDCDFVGSISRVRSALTVPGSGVELRDWVEEYVDDDDDDDIA